MNTRIPVRLLTVLSLALTLLAGASTPVAQSPAKKSITIDDYTKWHSISESEISPDGKFVAYVTRLSNVVAAESKPVLRLKNLETNEEVSVDHASDAAFSPDAKWIVYQVDPGAAQRARQGRGGGSGGGGPGTLTTPPGTEPAVPSSTPPGTPPPAPTNPQQPSPATQTPTTTAGGRGRGASTIPPRRVELRNLQTGVVRSWQDIGTATFSTTSTHLFLKRRAPEAPGGAAGGRGGGAPGGGQGGCGAAGSTPSGPRGLDVILRDLRTARHQLLVGVGESPIYGTGELLAYTVDANPKDGNGGFVFETRSGRITALDNDAKIYARLQWNEDGNGLAVLKGTEVEKMREKTNVLVAFSNIPASVGLDDVPAEAIVLDPSKVDAFPKGSVISDRTALSWSEDNKRLFFGIKEQVAAPPNERRPTDEIANVDVWNTADERIQSQQMIRADVDRNFTFRQAFDLSAKRYVKLTDDTMRDLEIAPDGRWAVGRDTRGYVHDHKRPAADFYRVDTITGARTLMFKNQLTSGHVFGITPHGKHFLYWKDGRFHAYDLEAGS